jgi:hypothetical protein
VYFKIEIPKTEHPFHKKAEELMAERLGEK